MFRLSQGSPGIYMIKKGRNDTCSFYEDQGVEANFIDHQITCV